MNSTAVSVNIAVDPCMPLATPQRPGMGRCPAASVSTTSTRAVSLSQPRLIVIGASAGGVEALKTIARELPAGLPAAVLVVVHFPPEGTSVLPQILERAGPLRAAHVLGAEPLQPGRIYIAPPDRHLLVTPGQVQVSAGARENGLRPAADPLFRSAARHYGRGVVGVVLSGNLNDGTMGLLAVRERGGITVVQDPAEALYPGMPSSAVEHARPDHICTLDEIGPLLVGLVSAPREGVTLMANDHDPVDASILDDLDGLPSLVVEETPPSGFTCPECHGALWETQEAAMVQFRCRVGHSFTLESLLAERSIEVEAALWTALTALEERIHLAKRLTRRMRERGNELSAARYDGDIRDATSSARILRDLLRAGGGAVAAGD
jgi:two-component system, chemotaxis family, protein-glutamate methylesterase/glutaminase